MILRFEDGLARARFCRAFNRLRGDYGWVSPTASKLLSAYEMAGKRGSHHFEGKLADYVTAAAARVWGANVG